MKNTCLLIALCVALLFSSKLLAESSEAVHVVQVMIDAGGGKYLEQFIQESPETFPNFTKIIREGATTFNARADAVITITQPNITGMLTGRPAEDVPDVPAARGALLAEKSRRHRRRDSRFTAR